MPTRSKPFTWIAAALFALMAIAHIIRLFTGLRIVVGSHTIPMWVSIVGLVIAGFLSWALCREARGVRPDEA